MFKTPQKSGGCLDIAPQLAHGKQGQRKNGTKTIRLLWREEESLFMTAAELVHKSSILKGFVEANVEDYRY